MWVSVTYIDNDTKHEVQEDNGENDVEEEIEDVAAAVVCCAVHRCCGVIRAHCVGKSSSLSHPLGQCYTHHM